MKWWIIGILVVVALFLFRAKEIKHRVVMLAIGILVLFLGVTMYKVYSTRSVDLSTLSGLVDAGKLYASWLGNIFHSGKNVVGYAFHQNWGFNFTNVTQ